MTQPKQFIKSVYKRKTPFKDFLKHHDLKLLEKLYCQDVIKIIQNFVKSLDDDKELDGVIITVIDDMKITNKD